MLAIFSTLVWHCVSTTPVQNPRNPHKLRKLLATATLPQTFSGDVYLVLSLTIKAKTGVETPLTIADFDPEGYVN